MQGPIGAPKTQHNAALAIAEYAAGVLTVSSTPSFLSIETTSRCNLRCVMCPHAIGAVVRPKHMEENLLRKLDRFIGTAREITLHGIGEPLNSPAFWQALSILPPPEVCDSSTNTNLTVLNDEMLKKLMETNLKIINVSLDAATADTYQKIRGFSFDTVVKNIQRLIRERHRRERSNPIIYLNMTLMRSNIEEVASFIELAKRLEADGVQFWHLNRWTEAEMARYVVERGGWIFHYVQEGLWNYPELSDQCITEALALAKNVSMPVYLDHNKGVFFDGREAGL